MKTLMQRPPRWQALAGMINGVPVYEEPGMVGTREVVHTPRGVLCFSFGALLQMLVARVVWHESAAGCPTWTGAPLWADDGCRCDVEGTGR